MFEMRCSLFYFGIMTVRISLFSASTFCHQYFNKWAFHIRQPLWFSFMEGVRMSWLSFIPDCVIDVVVLRLSDLFEQSFGFILCFMSSFLAQAVYCGSLWQSRP
jgi:hypothetical protein